MFDNLTLSQINALIIAEKRKLANLAIAATYVKPVQYVAPDIAPTPIQHWNLICTKKGGLVSPKYYANHVAGTRVTIIRFNELRETLPETAKTPEIDETETASRRYLAKRFNPNATDSDIAAIVAYKSERVASREYAKELMQAVRISESPDLPSKGKRGTDGKLHLKTSKHFRNGRTIGSLNSKRCDVAKLYRALSAAKRFTKTETITRKSIETGKPYTYTREIETVEVLHDAFGQGVVGASRRAFANYLLKTDFKPYADSLRNMARIQSDQAERKKQRKANTKAKRLKTDATAIPFSPSETKESLQPLPRQKTIVNTLTLTTEHKKESRSVKKPSRKLIANATKQATLDNQDIAVKQAAKATLNDNSASAVHKHAASQYLRESALHDLKRIKKGESFNGQRTIITPTERAKRMEPLNAYGGKSRIAKKDEPNHEKRTVAGFNSKGETLVISMPSNPQGYTKLFPPLKKGMDKT